VSNQSLNLIIELRAPDVGERFARVKVPAVLPRLVRVAGRRRGHDTTSGSRMSSARSSAASSPATRWSPPTRSTSSATRTSRSTTTTTSGSDLLIEMERQLSQRTFGAVVQLVCDATMPVKIRSWLADQLHATERDVYVVDGPLAMKGLFDLVKIDRPDLHDTVLIPTQLGAGDLEENAERTYWGTGDIFARVRQSDVMVHHPYQSFGAVTEFLRNAAQDPNVVAIKQTLYRLGKASPIIPELVVARDDDTQIAVLMEVKARFDEENNIALAHELETAGVHVAYGCRG
jgi:polyphosphate kinase